MSVYTDTFASDPIPNRFTGVVGTWSWDSTNQALQQTATVNDAYGVIVGPRSANFLMDVSADLTLVADPQGRKHVGFFLQAVDGTGFTGFRIVNLDNTWNVSRYAAVGSQGTLYPMSSTNAVWNVGETKTLRVTLASGGVFTLYVNGVSVGTWTDTTYPSLRPGFFAWNATIRVDNLSYDDGITGFASTAPPLISTMPYSTGALVTWTSILGAWGYDYRLDSGAITSVSAGTREVSLTGLVNGQTYTFQVRGTGPNGAPTTAWRSATFTPSTTAAIIYDSFNRTDVAPSTTALGSSTDGKAWTQPSGSLGIQSGSVYASASGENYAIFSTTWNQDIRFKLGGAGAAGNGIVFRYRDVNNYWLMQPESTGYAFYRRIGGSFTLMAPPVSMPPRVDSAEIRVVAYERYIRFYVNGVMRLVLEDFLTPTTDVGLGLRMDNTTARGDWFYARTPTMTDYPDQPSALSTVLDDGLRVAPSDAIKPSHVYKGRDRKTLDSVGAS